jgi:sRNA-binding regulator protein Hfq
MANVPNIPDTGLSGFRSEPTAKRNPGKLQAVKPAQGGDSSTDTDSTALPVPEPRKLVRPALPTRSFRKRTFSLHEESPILAHQNMSPPTTAQESSHAEAFYFQKQIQAQTPMIIVLEDGEQIEGCLEWYDRNAIKVKGSTRMLVYKAGIKYIYKAGEKRG